MTRRLIVLFDPGSTQSHMKGDALPKGATPRVHQQMRQATTLGGETNCNRSVALQGITFPEFTRSMKVDAHEFWIHNNSNVRYDVIIGRDLLTELKLDICHSDGTMLMEGRKILMKKRGEVPTSFSRGRRDVCDGNPRRQIRRGQNR
jgi:hypothetical protein